jgi:hypothetical protein
VTPGHQLKTSIEHFDNEGKAKGKKLLPVTRVTFNSIRKTIFPTLFPVRNCNEPIHLGQQAIFRQPGSLRSGFSSLSGWPGESFADELLYSNPRTGDFCKFSKANKLDVITMLRSSNGGVSESLSLPLPLTRPT